MQEEPNKYVKELTQEKYKYGFTTDVHTDIIEKGLNEDVVRLISEKKGEPEWLLEFRLKAYRHWLTLEMPTWAHLDIPEIDYQAISYYADPTKKKEGLRQYHIMPILQRRKKDQNLWKKSIRNS